MPIIDEQYENVETLNRVVRMGEGDVRIAYGSVDGKPNNRLVFWPAGEKHAAGELDPGTKGQAIYPHCTIEFANLAGLDTVMTVLSELRADMVANGFEDGNRSPDLPLR